MRFVGETLRITDYDVDGLVSDFHAERCTIVGPAVLMPLDGVHLNGGNFDAGGGGPESILWEIDPARSFIVGAVGIQNSSFLNCSFVRIGIAGSSEFLTRFLLGARPGN